MIGLARTLVGRDDELELLARLLDEARAGAPRFVFVSGEPGIGKTRLLAELVREAEEVGCLVLNGGAAEFERELPFGPLVDAFDEYLESLDPKAFHRLAAEDLEELAGVFPALRSLGPGSRQPSTPAQRFRAHYAARALVERLAALQPLVLALDDLQWADAASLELLSHLLRRPPDAAVLVAASFRTGQIDRRLLATIDGGTSGAVSHVELGPLGPAEAQALVDGAGAAEYERLYEASGGNPLYLLELSRVGVESGATARGNGDAAGVPGAVAAAIRSELDHLSRPARSLAEAAAVAGDPFELDLALTAAGMREPDALDALDELMACDLVRSAQVPRRFHFRHPLVRRAVYESCPHGVRIAAHERLADALATRGASAAARAHHVEHAAHHGDMAAVAVLREAGEEASRRAPVSAARWFQVALGLLPDATPAAERVGLLTALAEAQAATGRFEESRAALLDSIDLTVDSDESLRVSLIGACAGVEQLLGRHDDAHARLTAALDGLSDTSSPQAVELLIHLAVGDFYRMDYEGMRDWGRRALNAALPLGNLPLTAASTAVVGVAAAFMGAVAEAEVHRTAAAVLVDKLPDDQLRLRLDALANLSTAELYLHRYDDAADHAERGLAIARVTGQEDISPVLVPVLSAVLHLRGQVRESAELLDGAVEAARLSGNDQALGWNLLSQGFTAVAAGDLQLALQVAQESVDLTRDLDDSLVSTYASLALAEALCESGEARRAIDVLVFGVGGEDLPLIAHGWKANYLELLTRCWLALDRPAEAASAARKAEESAARTGVHLPAAMADRAAAAVALETGDPATAADRALASAAAAEEVGARVDAARARALAGRALARAGERDRGVAELESAVEQLDACGARRYRDQAKLELRKLGRRFQSRSAPGNASGVGVETLSAREVEIARLVVDRLTNREIANELVLSVKTIETHMRNIFRKLGVSSRVEVARTLERVESS